MTVLGHSGLGVFGLCLEGNVFGWTADEEVSFEVLDAYTRDGGNFIDTADVYAGGDAVSLAWLRQEPTVVAPIASATSVAQLAELDGSVSLQLTPQELARLAAAAGLG